MNHCKVTCFSLIFILCTSYGLLLSATQDVFTFKSDDLIIRGCPAVGNQGHIYFVSLSNGRLISLGADGSKNWEFHGGERSFVSPTIGKGGVIYFSVDNHKNNSSSPKLYAIYPDGKEKWSFETQGPIEASPAIGKDGTIYFGENVMGTQTKAAYFYALDHTGKEKWRYTPSDKSISIVVSPVIGDNGIIYIKSKTGLFALSQEGKEEWYTYIDGSCSTSPVIDNDGFINLFYSSNNEGYFCRIEPDRGSQETKRELNIKGTFSSPVIDSKGFIYCGTDQGKFYCFEKSGKIKWTIDVNGSISNSALLTQDKTVIFGTDKGILYAYDTDTGGEKWVFDGKLEYMTPATVVPDGTLYFATRNIFYARKITEGKLTLLSGGWPKFGYNLMNTGRKTSRLPVHWAIYVLLLLICLLGGAIFMTKQIRRVRNRDK